MHPILTRAGRFAAFLAAWTLLTALFVYLVAAAGGFAVQPAALVIAPAVYLYAFICFSTWFSCRLLPLERGGVVRLYYLGIHAIAAACAGALWAAAVVYFSRPALERFAWSAAEQARFASVATPLLAGGGVLLYMLSVAFHYVLLGAEARREAERREREARVLAGEAELRALKAQINPHFLFNSLNSISALTTLDPAGARQMCVLLADFMRRTLGLGEKAVISLADELALARSFLAIERVRFGERLHVAEQIATGAETCRVPPLLLQPLLENAIKHGVANLPEGGLLKLEAARTDGKLTVTIENAYDPESPPHRGNGMGIANVRRRLATRYGESASLRIQSGDGRFRVSLSLPAEGA